MFDDVAVHYLTDWDSWDWGLTIGLLAASVLVALSWRAYLDYVSGVTEHWFPLLVVPGVAVIASLVGLLMLPYPLMRHLVEHRSVGSLTLGLLALAVVLAVHGGLAGGMRYRFRSSVGLVSFAPAIALALGTLGGVVWDAFTRAAADVPTSVGVVVALVVVVATFAVLSAGRR